MNRFLFLPITFTLLLGSFAYARQSSNDWILCWMTAVELSKNPQEYSEAIEAYTAAIKSQDPNFVSKHLYLYNERAQLYLKTKDFNNAVKDFSFVLNQSEASKEEILDALWGRGQSYLASGKQQEFESDRKRLNELEPFTILLEENSNYILFKLGNHVCRDPQSHERLVKVLLMQKKIKFQQDVMFTPSGIAIVRKASSKEFLRR